MRAEEMLGQRDLKELRKALEGLVGLRFDGLSLPKVALVQFEPSQVGTLVGTLMDACLPFLPGIPDVGITKHEGILGEREGYPDYRHRLGFRLELKLLYVDNPAIPMKKPPTPREPSARVTQKVTVKNVDPDNDVLLVIAYRLEENDLDPPGCSPAIIDLGLFPMAHIVAARDQRMVEAGGRWFGEYETPTIPSRKGRLKLSRGEPLDVSAYGRKEAEGRDLNEDTNFGKLKRIPWGPLQGFLKKRGASYTKSGSSSDAWPD